MGDRIGREIRRSAPARAALCAALLLPAAAHAQVVQPAEEQITPLAQDGTAPPSAEPAADPVAAPPGPAGQDIVVTGSRVGRSGFTAPTPVTVVGEQRIGALAATNLGDVLVQLPAFRNVTSPQTALASGGAGGNIGARYLDLRGLGASRTLVLVDGRRFVPSSFLNAVDTNLIPSSLVKRVEIVTGGASAAYGSDAVSGVVNIILDNELEGLKGQVQRGVSERGDAQSTQVALAGGMSFAGGRGRIVVGGEYNKDEKAGNCYTRNWCTPEYALYQNPGFRTNGQPANFIASGVRPSTFTRTGLINSPGPLRGIKFNPDGTLAAERFRYGAIPDLFVMIGGEGEGDNFRLAVPWLRIPVERYSALANLDYDVSDRLSAFATLSYGNTKAQNRGAAVFERSLTIQADNAFLPAELRPLLAANNAASFVFGRQGQFDLDGPDLRPTNARGEQQTWRFAGGLKGDLGGSWRWDGYYQYGKSDYELNTFNVRNNANFLLALDAVRAPGGQIVCRSTLTSPNNGCVPLNLFGTANFSEAARNYAFGTPHQEQHIRQHVAAVNLRGDLFDTWAGPVSLATGLEYRQDKTVSDTDPISLAAGWQYGLGQRFRGKINVKEGYVETVVPLARDWSFAHLLDLNAAIRLTDYSTSGQATTWKAGLIYEPIDGIRLRATRSRDIRSPNTQELFASGSVIPGSIVDRTSNQSTIASIRTGGNPALNPEVARTWTAGVVLTPGGALRNLRLSADWFDISLSGVITSLGAQQIVDRCFAGAADLCDLITRGPDNVITIVRAPLLNFNKLVTRGLDVEADYRVDIGAQSSLGFRVLGSYLKDLITVDSAGAVDRAGQTGQQLLGALGLPKWTVTATTTFNRGPFTATFEARYIAKGKYDATLLGPEDEGYATTLANSIASNRVSDRLYGTLGLQYAVIDTPGKRVELYGAVQNLFDTDPPIAPGNTSTNPSIFDTIGRAYQVGVRFRY